LTVPANVGFVRRQRVFDGTGNAGYRPRWSTYAHPSGLLDGFAVAKIAFENFHLAAKDSTFARCRRKIIEDADAASAQQMLGDVRAMNPAPPVIK